MRFKIVQVRTRPMNLHRDIVPRAMRKEFSKACIANHSTRSIVAFVTMNRAALYKRGLNRGNRGIARIANSSKDLAVRVRLALRPITPRLISVMS